MNETFREIEAGDRISAREYNKLTNAVAEDAATGPPNGSIRVDVAGVRGTITQRVDLVMVRITGIVVPQSSVLYPPSVAGAVDAQGQTGANAYNAVIQLWDDDASAWADDPSADSLDVVICDDAPGWRPLVIGDRVPVMYKRDTGRYVPLESRETSVVMVTNPTPDSGGYYSGVMLSYSSESQSWLTGQACYILDIGLGVNPATGITGSYP